MTAADHPLIARLRDEFGYPTVDLDNIATFLAEAGIVVLYFPGNPQKHKDSTDVAVVLPELIAAFPGMLRPALVTSGQADTSLKERFAFAKHPALVFLRDGVLLEAICGIRDWPEYLDRVAALVKRANPAASQIPALNL